MCVVYVHKCDHICEGQRSTLTVAFQTPLTFYVKAGSHAGLEFTLEIRMAG